MSGIMAKPKNPHIIPTGVKCLELNVREVDAAVREFVARIGGFGPGIKIPSSWKFPHQSLDKVEIGPIIERYREQEELTPEQHYQNLLELLVDRLYYSLLASARFVKILSSALPISPKVTSAKKAGGGGGDSIREDDEGQIDEGALEESIGSGYAGIPVHNPFMPSECVSGSNLGFLLKQFYTRLTVVDSAVRIHLEKRTKKSKSTRSKRSLSEPSNSKEHKQLIHMSVQTDEKSLTNCVSCVATHNILKTIGETIECCLVAITKEESGIRAAKDQLRTNMFWCTQFSACTRWCEALQSDCNLIVQRMTETLKKNIALQDEVKSIQHSLSTQKRDHQMVLEAMEKRYFQLGQELAGETKGKAELLRIKEDVESKCQELENEVANRAENIRIEAMERQKLEEALSSLENIHRELKLSQEKSLEDFKTISEHLYQECKEKEQLKEQLLKYTDELVVKDQKISILNESVSELGKTRDENRMLRKRIENLKEEMSKSNHKTDKDVEEEEKHLLSAEIEKLKAQIELLAVYPDLNGPINPPKNEFTDQNDIISTMEDQVRANHLRIQLLTEQSERLSNTVDKLKLHLKCQAK